MKKEVLRKKRTHVLHLGDLLVDMCYLSKVRTEEVPRLDCAWSFAASSVKRTTLRKLTQWSLAAWLGGRVEGATRMKQEAVGCTRRSL
eukprot:197057-Amphidinium_carterae.1